MGKESLHQEPSNWREKARNPDIMAALMKEFERKHNFSFKKTSFKKLQELVVTPEMLVLKKEVFGGPLNALGILRHLLLGNIVIEPFNPDQLGVNSVDVRLGKYFFSSREAIRSAEVTKAETLQVVLGYRDRWGGVPSYPLYNSGDSRNAERIWWGPYEAEKLGDFIKNHIKLEVSLGEIEDFSSDALRVILIPPAQTILTHTEEFIGGRNCVFSSLRARSTTGRQLLTVCEDAGFGDIGYVNRWTMEMRNKSPSGAQLLSVGACYAQMIFYLTESLPVGLGYTGCYQEDLDLKLIKEKWDPKSMLPKAIGLPQEN